MALNTTKSRISNVAQGILRLGCKLSEANGAAFAHCSIKDKLS